MSAVETTVLVWISIVLIAMGVMGFLIWKD